MARIVLNKAYKIPEIKYPEMLSLAFDKGGVESTIALSKEIKAREGDKYEEFDVLGTIGYDLLDLKREKDAITLFSYLIEVFPKETYAFDYLGEAYLRDKNYEMAMVNFKKALDLDNSNEYAIKGIRNVEDALKKKL